MFIKKCKRRGAHPLFAIISQRRSPGALGNRTRVCSHLLGTGTQRPAWPCPRVSPHPQSDTPPSSGTFQGSQALLGTPRDVHRVAVPKPSGTGAAGAQRGGKGRERAQGAHTVPCTPSNPAPQQEHYLNANLHLFNAFLEFCSGSQLGKGQDRAVPFPLFLSLCLTSFPA